MLGFKGTNPDKLKKNADNARKWMNFHVLSENMTDFPNDIIAAHGN